MQDGRHADEPVLSAAMQIAATAVCAILQGLPQTDMCVSIETNTPLATQLHTVFLAQWQQQQQHLTGSSSSDSRYICSSTTTRKVDWLLAAGPVQERACRSGCSSSLVGSSICVWELEQPLGLSDDSNQPRSIRYVAFPTNQPVHAGRFMQQLQRGQCTPQQQIDRGALGSSLQTFQPSSAVPLHVTGAQVAAQSAWAGLAAGFLHTLCGPDHLAVRVSLLVCSACVNDQGPIAHCFLVSWLRCM